MTSSLEKTYNMCTAGWCSIYSDDLERIKADARTEGVRFVNKGGAYEEHREGGTMYTRHTEETLDLFRLFRDDEDFAGFLPVTHDEARIALDTLKAFREPAPLLNGDDYRALHPKIQDLYKGVWNSEARIMRYHLRSLIEEAA